MAARNLVASRKQQQHQNQAASGMFHRYKSGLLHCDALEETYGSGCGNQGGQIYASGSEPICPKHQQQPGGIRSGNHQQVQYVNGSDGSLLALHLNEHHHHQKQQQQHFPITRNNIAHQHRHGNYMQSADDVLVSSSVCSSSKPTSTGNLNCTPVQLPLRAHHRHHHLNHSHQSAIKQTYEVPLSGNGKSSQNHHRHLQHQVHQQLQQIYGDAERKQSQVQTISAQHYEQASDRQQLILKRHRTQSYNQPQQFEVEPHEIHRQRNMSTCLDVQSSGQFNEQHEQQQFRQPTTNKSQHLIMSNDHSACNNQQHKSSQLHQQPQPQEQPYDSLGPPGILKHQNSNGESFYVGPEPTVTTAAGGQRKSATQVINAIPEECGDDEDELLIPEHTSMRDPSKRAAIDRKNQLEDLHYATVTAAALLSATAQAAAAFAAAEKQFGRAKDAHKVEGGSCMGHQQANQLLGSIYSDAYQDIGKHRLQAIDSQAIQHHVTAAPRYKQPQQNMNRAPIYAVAIDSPVNQFVNLPNQRSQQQATRAAPSSAIYGPLPRVHHQSQIYHLLPAAAGYLHQRSQPQRVNFSNQRLQPPQPPLRRTQLPVCTDPDRHRSRMLQQGTSAITQQQQQVSQMPLTQPQAQALAILQRGGKGVSMRADMLGRLLVNNLMASQRIMSGDQDNHYGLVGGQHASSKALANRLMGSRGLVGRELMYGVSGKDELFAIPSRNNFHIQPAGVASSESSGHSNVPLVLERNLKSLSFIDRICRIDLTIFWWSLLIISFMFIGAIFALSRYIL